MTGSSAQPDRSDPPTTVLPVAAGLPAVPGVPAPRRPAVWRRRVPAKLGRSRTSTLVIAGLFVLLFALNVSLPRPETDTVPINYGGRVVQIPRTALPSDVRPSTPTTPAPAQTSTVPTRSAAPTTAPAPTDTDEATTTPRTTARTIPSTPERSSATTAAPRTTTGQDETTTAPTSTGTDGQRGGSGSGSASTDGGTGGTVGATPTG